MRNAVELRVIRSVDDEGVAVEGFGVSAATEFGIPAGPPNCYGSRTPHTHTHTRTHARTHARSPLLFDDGVGRVEAGRDAGGGSSRALVFTPTGGNIHN